MKAKRDTANTPSDSPKRVLIVDDHPFLRKGLSDTLSREAGLCVCGEAGSAEEALSIVEKLSPDIVVLDLNLPGKNGLELIKDLKCMQPDLLLIVLSMHDEEVYAERCLRAGASGYVMKIEGLEKLPAAIRVVLAGGIHVSPKISTGILKALAGGRAETPAASGGLISQLTDREFEIFEWLGRGVSTQGIAKRLHLSPKTVETHRAKLKAKLGLETAAELVARAASWVSAGDKLG